MTVSLPARAARPPVPRLLLVSEDALVAASLRREVAGRCVLEVVTSVEELLLRLAGGARFDLIVCDRLLAGPDGPAVRPLVASVDPASAERVLAVSGHHLAPDDAEVLALALAELLGEEERADAPGAAFGHAR